MIQYGYIIGEFTPKTGDVIWAINRYNKDGAMSLYFCIKRGSEISSKNVTIVGSNDSFVLWMNKYKPKTTI